MEFEYEGQIYRMGELKGGHNGRGTAGAAVAACQQRPPQWDEVRQRWVVPIMNNMINIDLSSQPEAARAFPSVSPLRSMSIINNPRRSYSSIGHLISVTNTPSEPPRFPVDCVFRMYIRVKVPGKGSVINVRPFELVAKGLTTWPPPVGTIYTHEDVVELYPEWIPFGHRLMNPIVRIFSGDETILTNVFEVTEPPPLVSGILPRLQQLINRLT